MSFIFVIYGPTSDKPHLFNTSCCSSFFYDQLKAVAFSATEAYSRAKDTQLRHALSVLEDLLASHRRKESIKSEDDAPNEGTDGFDSIAWAAETSRLEALKALREKQVCFTCCPLGHCLSWD